ncbi:PAS domain S-box protein [Flavobacterium sp. GB2R13]|uniref:sensor histidine kinase n=1 Tax=Flavobacterium algoris TaxID=3398733 RepID=UPI003A86DC68
MKLIISLKRTSQLMENLLFNISKGNTHLLKEQNIDDALSFCISSICEGQDIDRCYILKKKANNGIPKLYYIHEWCNEGIESHLGNPYLNGVAHEALDGLYHTLLREEPLYGNVKENANELLINTLEKQGVKSFLFTPIFCNDLFWGSIGYHNSKNERNWLDEEVYALQTIAENIGFRLNQEATISKLENTLEKLDFYMSGSSQAMCEYDLETNKTIYSHHWAKMLGYSNDEISSEIEFWKKYILPEDMLAFTINLENFIEGKSVSHEGTVSLIHKKGHIIWVKYSSLLQKNKEGILVKIIVRYIDINEIKEIENSEAKFRFITENTTDLICQHFDDGKFQYISSFCKEITGYTPEELINKHPWDFIHKKDLKKIENYLAIIKNLKNERITYRFLKKEGGYIWLETSAKVIIDAENRIIGFQTSHRDISERIKADEEIKSALLKERKFNELKSKFVSMTSHQLRTPLTVIYSNAELIDIKTSHFEKKSIIKIEPITTRIKNEVDRMTELMDNILIFGQYESEKIKKKIKPIDFNKFIKILIDTYFSNTHDGRKINLKIQGKRQILFTDETLMIHILTNLINNAFKYSTNRKEPILNINYLAKEIEIELIDYGIGIPKKEIQHLFTSFFRASNTNTIIGSGLGLAIVKQFAKMLNGKIKLETKENFGTTIKLKFPYEQK